MGIPTIQPGTINREESIANIIKSITMEEKAIAHVLHAESEKLEASINMSNVTIQQLLDANRSAKNTVDIAIQLENSIKNKLSMFSNTICQTN